jgi:hypothetical protein
VAFVDQGLNVRDEGFAAGEDVKADVFAAVGGVVLILRCHELQPSPRKAVLTIMSMHSWCNFPGVHSMSSWPACSSFVATSSSTRVMGGCGLTTPSSRITAMTSGRDCASLKMSERHGTGQHFGSSSHGVASMTALVAAIRESMLRLIGPMTDGTCS